MASAIYPKAKEAFLSGAINMLGDTIRCCLVDTGTYTYNAAHQFRSSLAGVAGGTHGTLSSKTITNGVFDAADTTMTLVSSATTLEAVVLYKDTGNPATDPLIVYLEYGSFAPGNGSNVLIVWP